jgi:hypothetical protein
MRIVSIFAARSLPFYVLETGGGRIAMKNLVFLGTLMTLALGLLFMASAAPAGGGSDIPGKDFKVLAPISHGNLTIFPVVAGKVHDTSEFLTLDEGVKSGEVVVTEVGNMHTMVRRRNIPYQPVSGAQVNRLVLVNNSKRPLILLAGEIVTGGKQDRVVGKDRIIAPESDPVDLSVFCVEPHRWVESSGKFTTNNFLMAQPSVRKQVVEEKDQQKVWAEVGRAKSAMSETIAVEATAPGVAVGSADALRASRREVDSTSSYAKARENSAVQKQVESITEPVQKSFESVIRQLRDQNAVGVVVAVKGRIIWADIFASNTLLSKYWPKLLQSYAAEALTAAGDHGEADVKAAQAFVDNWKTTHEVVDSEPGLYRQTEMTGDRFKAFELTSLLPRQSFDIHLSKMAE